MLLHKACTCIEKFIVVVTDEYIAPSDELTAYDGKHGAVVADGKYFVVTPYSDHPLDPPLGTQRVRMRSDGRYGQHDWTLWPQPFDERLCHFVCIPRYDQASPLRPLWFKISSDDFAIETAPTVLGSLGKLRGDVFLEIASAVGIVLKDCTRFVGKHSNPTERKLAIELAEAVQQLLNRVEFLTTTFRQMQVNCTTLQRLSLELVALIMYCEKYKPMIQGTDRCTGFARDAMGAFVTKVQDAERLFRAGIPYWFVHPVRNLLRIRIDNSMGPAFPEFEDYMPAAPVIYEGPPDLFAQHQAIMQHFGHLGSRNIFRESILPEFSVVSSTSTPIDRKKRNAPCTLIDYYMILDTNFFPDDSNRRSKPSKEKKIAAGNH